MPSRVLHPVHAHALGERRIDIHRLAGDAATLLDILDEMERAHVVQAIGELDQEDANVLRHRQHQLAEILGLLGLIGLQLDARQLGHAVDKPRNIAAEYPLDVIERRDRILDRVVQQPGDDRRGVELHAGEDAGDLDGMGEIGIAARPELRPMRLHREDIGAVERVLIGRRIIGPDALDQFELAHHRRHLPDAGGRRRRA